MACPQLWVDLVQAQVFGPDWMLGADDAEGEDSVVTRAVSVKGVSYRFGRGGR